SRGGCAPSGCRPRDRPPRSCAHARRQCWLLAFIAYVATQPEAVSRSRFAADEAGSDDERLLDEVIEILKAVFEPVNPRQRQRHVDPDLEEGVAERHLDVALIRQ